MSTPHTNEKNTSMATSFPGAHVEIAWSWELDGNGKNKRKKSEGCQRLKYLDSLGEAWKNKVSPTELIRASEDRLLWQRMVANVVDDGTATWHDMSRRKNQNWTA